MDVLGKVTKIRGKKIGEKDIYELNPHAGVGEFNMSWGARNSAPRPDSLRQQNKKFEKWFYDKNYDHEMNWKEKRVLFDSWARGDFDEKE